jgi:hypothetical protein
MTWAPGDGGEGEEHIHLPFQITSHYIPPINLSHDDKVALGPGAMRPNLVLPVAVKRNSYDHIMSGQ